MGIRCVIVLFVIATSSRAQTIRDFMTTVAVRARIVDSAGNIYLAGNSRQPLGAVTVQPTFAGGTFDAFVAKWTPDGTRLIYATNLGGSSTDSAAAISVDAAGNAYVTGYTYSGDFPVTAGAFQSRHGNPRPSPNGNSCTFGDCPGGDVFVAKISPDGRSLLYSTLLGGSDNESPTAIGVDSQGTVALTGRTSSPDFPVSPVAYLKQRPNLGTFVARLNSGGTALIYATYFEAAVSAVALDSAGNIYMTGGTFEPVLHVTPQAAQTTFGGNVEAFVASLNPSGSALRYATYLGGSNEDQGRKIQVNAAGEAWVAGETWSPDLAVTHALQTRLAGRSCPALRGSPFDAAPCGDMFIAKLSAAGDRFLFLTYLGGAAFDAPVDLVLEPTGTALILGGGSTNFPVTPDAWMKVACWRQSFARLSPSGELLAASFVSDLAFLTPSGSVMSWFGSSLINGAPPGPQGFACMLNAASLGRFVGGPLLLSLDQATLAQYGGIVAPGEIVTLAGWGLGPQSGVQAQADSSGLLPKQLAGVQALFNGAAAPLLYAQDKQINAIVPYSIAGATTVTVTVSYGGATTAPLTFLVDASAPAIFSQDGSGSGPATVLNQDGTLNSASNPASRGSIVQIFATGGGQTDPAAQDGQINPLRPGSLKLPVRVRFTEPIDAEILYAGPAPGLVSGAIQINARIPPETRTGDRIKISMIIGSSLNGDDTAIAVK